MEAALTGALAEADAEPVGEMLSVFFAHPVTGATTSGRAVRAARTARFLRIRALMAQLRNVRTQLLPGARPPRAVWRGCAVLS
jgi:hypothetical protein